MKKTRRLLSAVLAITLDIATTLNLAACGDNGSSHMHVFGKWALSQGETNCNGGTFVRICEDCGDVEERVGKDSDHVWKETGYNESHHWTACTRCEEKKDEAWHMADASGNCSVCHCEIPSEFVEYQLSQDGTYAIVVGYDKSQTNSIVIAPTYQGLPVKEIADSAFSSCARLEQVILPASITTIGANAFDGCKRLMAVYLSNNVTTIGENAFLGCGDLTIFTAYNAESIPAGWNENFNPSMAYIVWNHNGKRAVNVSFASLQVSDGMVRHEDAGRTQILSNPDVSGVVVPEGFSQVSRFDGKATPPGTPWTEGNLWHHNWDQTDLSDYQEVWFAAKLVNLNWVYVHDRNGEITPPSWLYIHMAQTGVSDDGHTLWTIETSIGGYVCTTIVNQMGNKYDNDTRAKNSIARLFWDEGFGSPDGNAILIYNFVPEDKRETHPVSIYCTEVLGVRKTSL